MAGIAVTETHQGQPVLATVGSRKTHDLRTLAGVVVGWTSRSLGPNHLVLIAIVRTVSGEVVETHRLATAPETCTPAECIAPEAFRTHAVFHNPQPKRMVCRSCKVADLRERLARLDRDGLWRLGRGGAQTLRNAVLRDLRKLS